MFSQQLVNGLMLGSVYALIGVGYTLVFGVLKMLNLAHAYLFMAAPFVAYALIGSGLPKCSACDATERDILHVSGTVLRRRQRQALSLQLLHPVVRQGCQL